MKFACALTFLPLLTLSLNLNSSPRDGLTCPNNIRSCMSQNVDSCCSPDLGILVLTQQWIPNYGPNNQFTLHGLWPNNCDGTYGPSDGCDDSRQYTNLQEIVSQDSELLNQMNTYWPSYKGDNPSFWQHEWGKHGTCMSTFQPRCYTNFQSGQDARDYFNQALKLRSQFDLYKTLADNNVLPGRVYSKNVFLKALSSLGAQVSLKCSGGAISEIQIYLYANGKSDFIITDAQSQGSCPKTINYPRKTT